MKKFYVELTVSRSDRLELEIIAKDEEEVRDVIDCLDANYLALHDWIDTGDVKLAKEIIVDLWFHEEGEFEVSGIVIEEEEERETV
jgi:hypothetical protein